MKKPTYAVGSEEGPVMYGGTVFKSQKQLNTYISISVIIIGIIFLASGFTWTGIIIGIVGIIALIGNIINKKKK